MSVLATARRPRFLFSSAEGYSLVRHTLGSRLPYAPHDYQLEGVCKLLDGMDLVAVLPTGARKTGYYLMYILVLLAMVNNSELRQRSSVLSSDPCMVVVYPTNGLEEEQASI